MSTYSLHAQFTVGKARSVLSHLQKSLPCQVERSHVVACTNFSPGTQGSGRDFCSRTVVAQLQLRPDFH